MDGWRTLGSASAELGTIRKGGKYLAEQVEAAPFTSTPFEQDVANRFGVLPNFFRLASSEPEITKSLWGFAQFAYLDNPMPSLFKERLFVYLSKFCRIRYCIARHLGFLVGLGRPSGDATCLPQTIEGVLPLLRLSVPRGEALAPLLKICAKSGANVFPEADSTEEAAVIVCATHVFLQTPEASDAHEALACRFDTHDLEYLNLFLAFIRTAHYWTKLHPELSLEHDVSQLLATNGVLGDLVLSDSAAVEDVSDGLLTDGLASMQELRKLQEHMSAIVESSDDAIVSKDLSGIIQSWNSGAERLFGYTAEEVIGKPITIIIPAERLTEEPEILSRLQRGERVEHFETIRRRKDGTRLNISLTISPVKDAHGTIVGASKVARDITGRVRQEQALKAANTALTRSNQDLEHFAYSASHDLQEPLRMVSMYGEMLQEKFGGKLGVDGDEIIDFIVNGATRMQQLLHDLRVFVQASTISQEDVGGADASAALQRSLDNLKGFIDSSQATVTHGDLPPVAVHQFQLEQLFQNLISNAIRYSGPATPTVHIEGKCSGGMCTFSVRDNGIGIEPQFKEQIFGIFKRLHTTADYPGTGMGLAICQRIVERSGGSIWVESEPGRGSTFYFTVPAAGHSR